MSDALPPKVHKNECAIINLDVSKNAGSHWVAYVKCNNVVNYFDSFGALKPPKSLVNYLGEKTKIFYNNNRYQNYNQSNCGQLCLDFLYKNKHVN